MALDLTSDPVELTRALVDVESVSGNEGPLADLVEAALRTVAADAFTVERDGNVVWARTASRRGRRRVVLAGHLDTVPLAGNLPARRDGSRLLGCGTSDMKSGLAVMLRIAAAVGAGTVEPTADLTWVFYDGEEVEAARNGLGRLTRERPDVLAGDVAVLLEGTNGAVEAGCQGTMRALVRASGVRAHSARSWLGRNAIHALTPVLDRLAAYEARTVVLDGMTYREGLNAVRIEGGVAGNVIPDDARLTVNFRFAPDRSVDDAETYLRGVLGGTDLTLDIVDAAPAAPPSLDDPFARAVIAASGQPASGKLGWTDVARFTEIGIPAFNLGPGDPNLAHTRGEYVETARIAEVEATLLAALTQ